MKKHFFKKKKMIVFQFFSMVSIPHFGHLGETHRFPQNPKTTRTSLPPLSATGDHGGLAASRGASRALRGEWRFGFVGWMWAICFFDFFCVVFQGFVWICYYVLIINVFFFCVCVFFQAFWGFHVFLYAKVFPEVCLAGDLFETFI